MSIEHGFFGRPDTTLTLYATSLPSVLRPDPFTVPGLISCRATREYATHLVDVLLEFFEDNYPSAEPETRLVIDQTDLDVSKRTQL